MTLSNPHNLDLMIKFREEPYMFQCWGHVLSAILTSEQNALVHICSVAANVLEFSFGGAFIEKVSPFMPA